MKFCTSFTFLILKGTYRVFLLVGGGRVSGGLVARAVNIGSGNGDEGEDNNGDLLIKALE